jgi:hypothetical protein
MPLILGGDSPGSGANAIFFDGRDNPFEAKLRGHNPLIQFFAARPIMTGRLDWKSLLLISRRGSNADGNLQRAGLRQCIQEISRYPSTDSSGVERLAYSLSSLLRARRCISRRRPWSNGKTAPFSRGSLEEASVLVCSHVADSRPWGICDPHHSQGGQDYRISRGSH